MDELVSTNWLATHLDEPDVVAIDASLFMPGSGRDGAAEFRDGHIPGARFLDIEALSDPDHPAPHMLPSAAAFGTAMEALGVGRDDRLVVYDNSPVRSAVRGWFMLRHFGTTHVAVLDGGLGKWRAEGRPIEQCEARPRSATFDAVPGEAAVTKQDILAGLNLPLVDARGAARFEGREADPRTGVASGHIPGSRNLPFAELFEADGTLKGEDELRAAFVRAGVDPQQPFVATCGSGVTANSLIFAARRLGGRGGKLYDGSWSEWGADPATPKAMGPA